MAIANKSWVIDLLTKVQEIVTPMGTVSAFMRTTAPSGWLACDGTEYNIEDYSKFASFIEEQFGSVNYFGGDGTTTFAVPDLRGEFLRGSGTNSHTNQGSGDDVGAHQDGTNINKIGFYNSGAYLYRESNIAGDWEDIAGINNNHDSNIVSTTATYIGNIGTINGSTNAGQNVAYTSRPTNTSVLYCIKYK